MPKNLNLMLKYMENLVFENKCKAVSKLFKAIFTVDQEWEDSF